MAKPKFATACSISRKRTCGSRVRLPPRSTRLMATAMLRLGRCRGGSSGCQGGSSGLGALGLDALQILARTGDDQLAQDGAAQQRATLDLVDRAGVSVEVTGEVESAGFASDRVRELALFPLVELEEGHAFRFVSGPHG